MPLLRPPPTIVRVRNTISRRTMASHSHGHESPYDPPTGWFLNQNPAEPPAKREGWEPIIYWGFLGSLFAAGVAYAYKPDTSIQTWALEEARRRLETEGVIPDSTKPRKITDTLQTVSGK
ncbi:hypothetical protein K440DRAFT_594839 [Wilcoxina mikolae CBS 423.85]|nr:hypothetical protein K440DRAFT_594839 [Wilcoxina mikolae CBS 423.85]